MSLSAESERASLAQVQSPELPAATAASGTEVPRRKGGLALESWAAGVTGVPRQVASPR